MTKTPQKTPAVKNTPAVTTATPKPQHPLVSALHKATHVVVRAVAPRVRPFGMHPDAWAAFLKSGVDPRRVGQTIGGAPASGGTHLQDGNTPVPYAVCTDLHVRDQSHAGAVAIAQKLIAVGFCVYVRIPGVDHWPSTEVYHVHFIWPGAPMKEEVAHQVRDFLNDPTLNGLASHVRYELYQATHDQRVPIRALFSKHYSA